jgi:hypothetical protein
MLHAYAYQYVRLKHILTVFFNVDVVLFGKKHCNDAVSLCLLKELEFSDKCFSLSIPETYEGLGFVIYLHLMLLLT